MSCWIISCIILLLALASRSSGSDLQALLAFKKSLTNSDVLQDWIDQTSSASTSGSFCTWTGVTCSRKGDVTSLVLNNMGLQGRLNLFSRNISKTPGSMLALESIDLGGNQLYGDVPWQEILSLPNLKHLDLSSNAFSGEFLIVNATSTSLTTLDLSSNSFAGELDHSGFGVLSQIEELSLASNGFTGEIPAAELSKLSKLRALDLSSNLFSGELTPLLQTVSTTLEVLDVSNNSLKGSIPEDIGRISGLRRLMLGLNENLSGPLPLSLSNLTGLEILHATSCRISGPLPASLSRLTSLEQIELSNNPIASPLPEDMFKGMASLKSLSIASASLNGTIPTSLGRYCSRLELVNLAFNSLTGDLPSELQRLTSMVTFSVEGNSLTGTIPPWLASWSQLDALLLSSNALTGSLPLELGLLQSVTDIGLDNNELSGDIPPEICGASGLSQLTLDRNKLTGDIDSAGTFFKCYNLTQLGISSNMLTGRLPSYLPSVAPKLVILDVSSNGFTGSIPQSLWSSSSLMELDVSANKLTGDLQGVGRAISLQHLYLDNNMIGGEIPGEVGNLSNLTVLSISNNRLRGEMPGEMFKLTTSLTTLNLGGNMLTGRIPSEIGQLLQLDCLVLSKNRLSGLIPSQISATFRAETPPESGFVQHHGILDLSNNLLSGGIPAEIGDCATLTDLNLAGNMLTAGIPSELGKLTNLTTLDLNGNALNGRIPASLGNNRRLQGLNLAGNMLSGSLPSDLGQLSRLVKLNVSRNMLTGELPGELGKLSGLTHFDVSRNLLQGEIPATITGMVSIVGIFLQENKLRGNVDTLLSGAGQWRQVQTINVSCNFFEGNIPGDVGNITAVSVLDFRRNAFTGQIPHEIGHLVQLSYLDIAENQFVGTVPGSICELTELVFFNASSNVGLSGQVPQGGSCGNFSRDSFLGDLHLCGDATGVVCLSQERHHQQGIDGPRMLLEPGTIWGITAAVTATCFLVIYALVKKRLQHKQDGLWLANDKLKLNTKGCSSSSSSSGGDLFSTVTTSSSTTSAASGTVTPAPVLAAPLLRLTLGDIVAATNNFAKANVIGDGGFGTVYRATLRDGRTVAVKKLAAPPAHHGSIAASHREFLAEMETLGKVRHPHLVTLLGYCALGDDERLLVYDYMVNGSLDIWLRNRADALEALSWPRRLRIALGAARGLAFLHHGVVPKVIHRDVKASNILIDHNFEPRVSDFGLARLVSASDTHVSTDVAGTFGYIPPEYAMCWRATSRGDVYSYGVILLELLTGKEPTGPEFGEAGNLVGWTRSLVSAGKSAAALDVGVAQPACTSRMLQLLHIALCCTADDPLKRPAMIDIVRWIRDIESADSSSQHLLK